MTMCNEQIFREQFSSKMLTDLDIRP